MLGARPADVRPHHCFVELIWCLLCMEPRQEAYTQPLADAASLEACRPTFGASYFPDASAYITSAKAVNSSKFGFARKHEQPWKAEQVPKPTLFDLRKIASMLCDRAIP